MSSHRPTRALPIAAILLLAAAGFASATAAEVRTGKFAGASNHQTRGTVTVRSDAGATVVILSDDFFFDGAPDPKLAFGNHQTIDKATIFAPLARETGRQSYRLPAGVDPSGFSHLYLWCERFAVPLGKARLTSR